MNINVIAGKLQTLKAIKVISLKKSNEPIKLSIARTHI